MVLLWRAGLPMTLLALCNCGPAWAQASDGFSMSASYSLQRDSNLFRLPDGLDPRLVLGTDRTDEDVRTTSLGLSYNGSFSLQRIELNASLVDHDYQRFHALDLLATNYGAQWHWQVTPRVKGRAYAERKETVNSFGDTVGTPVANQRVTTATGITGRYELDGAWRAVAALRRSRDQSEQQQLGQDSYRARSMEMGLLREAPSGSNASVGLRRSSGRTLDANGQPMAQRDNLFTQTDLDLQTHWVYSAKLLADLGLTRLTRNHPSLPDRDYSGWNGNASLRWTPTAKTAWTAGWSSQMSSYQTGQASYSRAQQLQLGFVWQVQPRTQFSAGMDRTQRRYLGAPAGQPADPRRDTLRRQSIGVSWSVHRNLSLNASVQRSQRSSSAPGLDYSATQTSLGLSAGF